MNCRKVSRRLSSYIDNDLSPEEKGLIEEHLSSCSSCRRKAADIKLIVEAAGQMERVEPGPYFVNRVLCAIGQKRSPSELLTNWGYRLTLSGVAFVVAASVTFFIIGPSATMVAQAPAGDAEIQAGAVPPVDSSTITEKGFPVSEKALQRDMALTKKEQPDSTVSEPEVLPRHYVQPVGIKKKTDGERVF
jgi:anti-sigma factor RsiW